MFLARVSHHDVLNGPTALDQHADLSVQVCRILCELRSELDAEIALSPGFRWGTTALAGQPLTMEDILSETAITYPATYAQKMSGAQIRDVLEDVCDNLFNADHRRVSDRIQAYALYIDPPLGRCGMTDGELRKSGRRALSAKYPMSRVSRAYEKGETQGFIKISVDAETKHILGAAILGTGGDEVVHVLLDVMYAKAPYTVVQRAMHIHPTVAEYLPTVLSKLEPFA